MATGRREVLGGMAASLLLARGAGAAAPGGLFAGTPLAANRVAAAFRRIDLALPDVAVVGAGGPRRLPSLTGKPRLLTLWAEWCVPCLLEARDLAALRPRVVDDRFDIVSVLTGSVGKLDYAGAVQRLQKVGATGLTVLVEPNGGHAIAEALSVSPPPMATERKLLPGDRVSGFTLPCTLLVDRQGRVRGRATGIATTTPAPAGAQTTPGHALTAAEKQALLTGGTKTAWSTADGPSFLQALHDGALDRV